MEVNFAGFSSIFSQTSIIIANTERRTNPVTDRRESDEDDDDEQIVDKTE